MSAPPPDADNDNDDVEEKVEQVADVFTNLTTGEGMDQEDMGVMEIESMCMNCHENGISRLLLMEIPFFKKVMVMAFTCPHCHYRSNEIENAGEIGEKGIDITLEVKTKADLNRQLVKTKYCVVKIPDLDFEIPAQRGELTTVEGILQQTIDGLQMQQVLRRIQHPDVAASIDEFCDKLRGMQAGETPFRFNLNDSSGNSFIENPHAPAEDSALVTTHYFRNKEQNTALGIGVQYQDEAAQQSENTTADATGHNDAVDNVDASSTGEGLENGEDGDGEDDLWNTSDRVGKNEALIFHDIVCPECNAQTETRMKVVDIPHFKEVIVMATTCDNCGYKTSDVRVGGAIEPKGVRITLKITCKDDLSRDILKTDTASLEIPELELTTSEGILGGGFTTIEGILTQVADQLAASNQFLVGDSSHHTDGKLMNVVEMIRGYAQFSEPFHLILDDPVGNSHIQNLYAPDPDPEMTIEYYERTDEQNADFGLTEMKTEKYEE